MGRGESSYKNIEWISLRNNLVDFLGWKITWGSVLKVCLFCECESFGVYRGFGIVSFVCARFVSIFCECCEVWLIVIII